MLQIDIFIHWNEEKNYWNICVVIIDKLQCLLSLTLKININNILINLYIYNIFYCVKSKQLWIIYFLFLSGIHNKNTVCTASMIRSKILHFWRKFKHQLFKIVKYHSYYLKRPKEHTKGYGGWSDKRDQFLCSKIMSGSKSLLQLKIFKNKNLNLITDFEERILKHGH